MMPDIIINGMEMPSGCRACKLNNDTICALINGCVYDETDGSTRRPDCPLRPAPEWISVESRPMDEDERKEWSERLGYDIEYEDAVIYVSQLPEDGQEVLVYKKWGGVSIDKFEHDPDYGVSFEENGDMDGIVAWMPLPEPPKGGDGDGK